MAVRPHTQTTAALVNLPDEIQLTTINYLTFQDLNSLSSTCQLYRQFLVPRMFKCIKLREHAKSGVAVQALIDKGYSAHVKELRFVAHAEEEDEGESDLEESGEEGSAINWAQEAADSQEDGDKPATDLLSSESEDVLSQLVRFPHLETLRIEFSFDIANWSESIHIFMDGETEDGRRKAERCNHWRKLMLRTFRSLTSNGPPLFSGLELINLPSVTVSVYESQEFNNFLGGLRSFKLNLLGGDNGAGWHINTQPGWQIWIPKIKAYFFDHLTNVETVIFEAPEEGPIGLEGQNHAPLPFAKGQMPHLSSLTLKCCFVEPALVEYLSQQLEARKLEELHLQHCHSSKVDYGDAYNSITWAEFFQALSKTKPRSLRKLVMTDAGCYPNETEIRIVGYDEREDDAEVKEVRARLEDGKGKGRKLFSYVRLDDKYGMVFPEETDNRKEFLEGKDQRAYDDLMGRVKENALRRKTTSVTLPGG
ncbi:MAG: hypothetical protein Q9160_006947 [Pyrenula sp. 1 TL-2023]